MGKSVGFISLGCAKNQVNTEQMIFLLKEAGYEISATTEQVDVAIVNTCGFIQSANAEAVDIILTLAQQKKAGDIGNIIVTGCMAQRYQEEILTEMPEVDGIVGTGSYNDIAGVVERVLTGEKVWLFGAVDGVLNEPERVLTTPDHYAYLRIAEGCDNHCAYCIIPKLRGKYRSRPFEDLMIEAKKLADAGVKELIVIAQDTSRYGTDLYGERRLPELLEELCKIQGFAWVRIHYLYPDELTDELIDVIAKEPKIVKYLDIPIQHVNDKILEKMNRRGNHAYLDDLFTKLRAKIPGVALRTSLIAGLPYEDEDAFEELCLFLKKHKLERMGAFVFSPEEGTVAATMDYPDRDIATRRAEILTELGSRIIDAYNESKMETDLEVLCEGYDEENEAYYGRSYSESPDIDGKVWFVSDDDVAIGSFVTVHIVEMIDGELAGFIPQEEDDA